jgi:hypothetical protein
MFAPLRRVIWLLSLVILLVSTTSALRTTDEIIQAFHNDGFGILNNVSTTSGARGFMAYSYNSTTRSTGLPKRAYYVEGTSYEMGYLIGLLDEPSVSPLTYDYVNKFFPALIIPSLAQKLANNSLWQEFEVYLGEFLVAKSSESFLKDQHLFPSYFAEEMKGVADGAKAANPSTLVTYNRVIALSYVLDFVLAHAYSGNLFGDMMSFVQSRMDPAEFAKVSAIIDQHIEEGGQVLQLPIWCEAFGGNGFLARDFQLVTADVFQDYQVSHFFVSTLLLF